MRFTAELQRTCGTTTGFEVPSELAEALAADPVAARAWEALSYSHQRQHALAIEGAKAAETRARRVEKTLDALRANS